MIPVVLFLLSIGLQLAAAVFAILLIRITDRRLAWIFLSLAMVLMSWRRIVSFTTFLIEGRTITFDLPEIIALIISVLMLAGVLRIRTYFYSIRTAEEALRESEQRYRELYENVPTMNFTIDASGTVLLANNAAIEQLGYTLEELSGQSVLKVFYEDDRPAVLEQLNACLQSPGRVFTWELRKVRKDGAFSGSERSLVPCRSLTATRLYSLHARTSPRSGNSKPNSAICRRWTQ